MRRDSLGVVGDSFFGRAAIGIVLVLGYVDAIVEGIRNRKGEDQLSD